MAVDTKSAPDMSAQEKRNRNPSVLKTGLRPHVPSPLPPLSLSSAPLLPLFSSASSFLCLSSASLCLPLRCLPFPLPLLSTSSASPLPPLSSASSLHFLCLPSPLPHSPLLPAPLPVCGKFIYIFSYNIYIYSHMDVYIIRYIYIFTYISLRFRPLPL